MEAAIAMPHERNEANLPQAHDSLRRSQIKIFLTAMIPAKLEHVPVHPPDSFPGGSFLARRIPYIILPAAIIFFCHAEKRKAGRLSD
jgi:hypothetical protein